jgi:hypothetical protein
VLVSGLVIPFIVVRGSDAVGVCGKLVKFRRSLV